MTGKRRVWLAGAMLLCCGLAIATAVAREGPEGVADRAVASAGAIERLPEPEKMAVGNEAAAKAKGATVTLSGPSTSAYIGDEMTLDEGDPEEVLKEFLESLGDGPVDVRTMEELAKLQDGVKDGTITKGLRACADCLSPNAAFGDIGSTVWGYSVSANCGTGGKWYASFNGYAGYTYHFDLCPNAPGAGTGNFDADIKVCNSACAILSGTDGSCSGGPNSWLPNDFQWVCSTTGTYYVVIAPYRSYDQHNCTGTSARTFTMQYYAKGDPCAGVPPPSNDDCSSVTPVTLTSGVPQVFAGDNTCATNDGGSCFGPEGETWHAFTLSGSATGWDVTLDYCGTSPAFGNAWLNCALDCPCTTITAAADYDTVTCGDGNLTLVWSGLADGTYWYPVILDPAYSAEGPYTLNVVAVEHVPTYCDASGGCDEHIDRVQVGAIDNLPPPGTDCSAGGYADYTALYTKMHTGATYPLTVTIGTPYGLDKGGCWIDWNQDLDFDDAGETITTAWTGVGPYTANIAVPLGTPLGDTRMRVRVQYSGTTPVPCGVTSYGEVEDYRINVIEPPLTGACCVDDVCLDGGISEEACINTHGGVYQGDGSDCDPNPCVGACCYWPSGTCTDGTEEECIGGTYMGDATTCGTTVCPTPGDDCTDPMPVTLGLADLPYVNNNTNCGRIDDYDDPSTAHCLYYYDSGEDMIYELTVTEAMNVNITLDPGPTTWAGVAIGVACPPTNDCIAAAYSSAAEPHVIECVHLEPGVYYIQVDTWATPDCIPAFTLTIEECIPCDVVCVGTSEGEPDCGDPIDTVNGGCNSSPPVFGAISCGETICGTAYYDGTDRDTDWYQLVVASDTEVTVSISAEFDVVAGIVDSCGTGDCADATAVSPYVAVADCETGVVSACLPPGTWWLFVGPDFDGAPFACGLEYDLGLECAPCTADRGACCLSDGLCKPDQTECQCLAIGGTWEGPGTVCEPNPCPVPPACPPDSLFSQPSVAWDTDPWAFVTSDEATGYIVYENFSDICGQICDLRWWAQNGYNSNGWYECNKDPERVNIVFYPDDGSGMPDTANPVCQYLDVTPTKTDTGLTIDGWILWEYEYTLPSCCVLVDGWISIEGVDDGSGCWFMWANSLTGDNYSFQFDGISMVQNDYNMSLCLGGTSGGVLGACCDDATSTCTDDVGCDACPAPMRWTYDTLCADIEPPCGTGACCYYPSGDCTDALTELDCTGDGGTWQGAGTTCAATVCPTPGETCSEPMVIPSVPYSTTFDNDLATADDAHCNPSYSVMQNDFWFSYTPDRDCDLVLDVDPDIVGYGYDAVMGVYEGPDCYSLSVITCLDDPEPYHVEFAATAGTTYWFQIGDYGTTEGGGATSLDLTCQPVICGDFTGPGGLPDGLVNADDFWFLVAAFGSCSGQPLYQEVCDLVDNDCIDFVDYQAWVQCYRDANGRPWNGPPPRPKPGPHGTGSQQQSSAGGTLER